MRPASAIPVKENEELAVLIENIGDKGDGIAKVQGFIVIVPNVIAGKKYLVRITAVKNKFAFAQAIEKIK